MVEAVLTLDEVEKDPHALARDMIVEMDHPTEGKVKGIGIPIKFSDTEAKDIKPPPILGEHNDEVFAALGVSEAERQALRTRGVI